MYHKNDVSGCLCPLQSPRKREEGAQERAWYRNADAYWLEQTAISHPEQHDLMTLRTEVGVLDSGWVRLAGWA